MTIEIGDLVMCAPGNIGYIAKEIHFDGTINSFRYHRELPVPNLPGIALGECYPLAEDGRVYLLLRHIMVLFTDQTLLFVYEKRLKIYGTN